MLDATVPQSILFVCLGNICRSPMAEGVFRRMVEDAGAGGLVRIDSAGTSDYHAGHSPDRRAQRALRAIGIDISALRARQVSETDFVRFDRIYAMDRSNLENLLARAAPEHHRKIALFLDLVPGIGVTDVPDPYFGGEEGFAHVLGLVTAASRNLALELGLLRATPES
jgi:protein-tyrosine phosphatase